MSQRHGGSRVYGSTGSSPRFGPQSPVVHGRDVNLQMRLDARSSTASSHKTSSHGGGHLKPDSGGGRRRHGGSCTKSGGGGGAASVYSSSESMLSHSDYEKYEMLYEKRRSAIGVLTGIFTCWPKSKEGHTGSSHGGRGQRSLTTAAPRLNAAALLEQAKAQQEALLETQDASDMWEWHMEQQQAIATQEHELLERTSNAGGGDQLAALPAIVGGSGRSELEDDEVPGRTSNQESPANWGWRRQEEIAAERVLNTFEAALLRCRWEINTFCRVYMQQIVRAGYSLINTLMEMEPNTVFLKRVHASYALEARITAALFRCFENDSFDESGLTHIFDPGVRAQSRLQEFVRMKGVDPAEALRMHAPTYEPAFHTFAAAKSEEVLALLPAAALAFRSATQRDRFMDAFLRAAKWAWLLHRLATSTSPPATILRVARGHPVDPVFVEAVAVPPIGSCPMCPVTALPAVEFMIMPGFIAQRKVFRSRVYQHYMCKRQ